MEIAFLFLAFLQGSLALNFTYPFFGHIFSESGPNLIAWNNTPGDPPFANFQLLLDEKPFVSPNLTDNEGFFAIAIPLGNAEYDWVPFCEPGQPMIAQGQYTIRAISKSPDASERTLGESQVFNVTQSPDGSDQFNCTLTPPNPSDGPPVPPTVVTSGASSSPTSLASNSGALATSGSSSFISNGAIAGIVIGALVFIGLLFAGLVYYNRRKRRVKVEEFGLRKNIASPVEPKFPSPL